MDLSYLYVPLNCRVVEIPPPSLRGCDTNACTFTCNKIEFCTILGENLPVVYGMFMGR